VNDDHVGIPISTTGEAMTLEALTLEDGAR